ncbi:MAG: universal stress protein [Caldilineaceae bacterium]|nr:universal stress protein [Caldilineaceae bacterium]
MSLPYSKIMVPLDGSDLAANALPHAVLLAQSFGAELVLVRVVDDLARQEPEMMEAELHEQGVELIRQQLARTTQQAEAELGRATDELTARSLETTAVVLVGEAPDLILDYAHRSDVDLIVMSTHGRTGLSRWLFGSVAEKVYRRAHCPVLIVRVANETVRSVG